MLDWEHVLSLAGSLCLFSVFLPVLCWGPVSTAFLEGYSVVAFSRMERFCVYARQALSAQPPPLMACNSPTSFLHLEFLITALNPVQGLETAEENAMHELSPASSESGDLRQRALDLLEFIVAGHQAGELTVMWLLSLLGAGHVLDCLRTRHCHGQRQ